MPRVTVDGCGIHYDVAGSGEPLLLLVGLGGVGRAWGDVIELFAEHFLTIVPDHRGTGASDTPDDGYSIAQHAVDMAAVLSNVDAGPAHIVGSSTGGAIAQQLALDHADLVRSIVVADSWAQPDDFFRHQFETRKQILVESGSEVYTAASALFLYSPQFFRDHYDQVVEWVARVSAAAPNPELLAKRIDMIIDFDEHDRLGDIDVPALVVVGSEDMCTPPYFSQELASLIPGADYVELPGGHLIYKEAPGRFFDIVREFLERH